MVPQWRFWRHGCCRSLCCFIYVNYELTGLVILVERGEKKVSVELYTAHGGERVTGMADIVSVYATCICSIKTK